jgi:outer membrane autotransporter protein
MSNMNISTNTDFALASNQGRIALNNSAITSGAGLSLFTLDDGFVDVTNGSNVATTDTVVFDVIDGTNTITVNNSTVTGGNNQLLSTAGTATASLNATNSNLTGSVNGSDANVSLNNSTWFMREDSTFNSLNASNGSNIFLANETSGTYNRLTVQNYNVNGTVWMNTFLGSDGSPSDQIVILDGGTATGNTSLRITNDGGSGGYINSNGIKLIDAQGSALTFNTFNLYGYQVELGAFVYYLDKGGLDGADSESWFLRGTPQLNNSAGMIANEPSVLISKVKTGLNSLNRRMGELRDNSLTDNSGSWVRVYGRTMEVKDFVTTDYTLYGIEGGFDRKVSRIGNNQYYLGVMAGYMHSNDVTHTFDNAANDGRGTTTAPSVGVYGTWMNNTGWFADATLRVFQTDMDLTAMTAAGTPVRLKTDRMATAASVEVGRQFTYTRSSHSRWLLEPKFEVIGMYAPSGSFHTDTGNSLTIGDTSTVISKASLMVSHHYGFSGCSTFQPFVQISLLSDHLGRTAITYADAIYHSDVRGHSIELKTGLNMQMTARASFFSEFSYEVGEKFKSMDGNIGFRYTW